METGSYVSGTATLPLIGETIGRHFARAAEHWAGNEALVVRRQDIRWTYRELHDRVEDLAAGLVALGLEPGARIGIWSPNRAEWVLLQLASAKAGLILVSINPAYRLDELEHALSLSGCAALVLASRFKSSDYLAMIARLVPELAACEPGRLASARLPELRWVVHLDHEPQGTQVAGMLAFDAIAEFATAETRRRLAEIEAGLQFDQPINIQFTSGTTGRPKGATLSHHNILNNGFFVAEGFGLREGDRLCIPVPLYHCFGMVMSVLACLSHGATMVFPGEGFDALSVLETIEAERCTHLHGVPTMFIAQLEHPEFRRFDLSSLKGGIMSGAPCPIEVMRRVRTEMHLADITIAYGMTETSPVSFLSAVDDPVERRVSTVGRVMPHVEAKIVDALGRVVPRGVPGELYTRGYSVMRGYWNDPERTAEAVDAAGWMHTGDMAEIDAEGYARIVGRFKDMIIRGGENIYPREIEEFLFGHPAIETAQVFGVPDARMGEELCAWVKLRQGASLDADALRDFCRERIAHYKIPRYVFFVDAFPMTVTGKIQKFVMRRQAIEALELQPSPKSI